MSTKPIRLSTEVLPEEIIREILLSLPVKSLLRFRAVCKSWRSIISTSTFIDTHRRVIDGQQLLLLHASLNYYEPFSLHHDNPSFNEHTKFRNPFLAYERMQLETVHVARRRFYTKLASEPTNVVGTCNGLVCLVAQDFTALIWNPSIRKFIVLAKPSVTLADNPRVSYAFGHDSRTNDYKVLRAVYTKPRGVRASCEVEIWSLARGCWKSLTASIDIPGDCIGYPKFFLVSEPYAFVNGALHWFHNKFKDRNYKDSIVTFDVSSESFGEITMPEFWNFKEICLISGYKDYTLAFIEKDIYNGDLFTLWVMEEYGVGDSCVRMFTLPYQGPELEPVWFRNNSGDVVLKVFGGRQSRHVSVDFKTRCTTEFQIGKYVHYFFMGYFVESLVLLNEPNVISY